MKTIRKNNIFLSGLALMAGIISLSGCSSSDDVAEVMTPDVTDAVDEEIKFSTSIPVTRTFDDWGFNTITSFQAGDSIRLWVDDCQTTDLDMSKTPKAHYGYTVFSVDNSNLTTGSLFQRRGTALKYPTSGNRVNIYAMRINATTPISDGAALPTTTGLVHKVLTDQSTLANFCQSDMLYGELKYQPHTKNRVTIPFKHALAKISVQLAFDDQDINDNLSSMQITETMTEGIVTINRSKKYGDTSIEITPTGAVETIEMDHDGYNSNVCAIIPQTIAANTKFIHFTCADLGKSFTFKLASTQTFEAGKEYRFYVYTSEDLVYDVGTIKVSEVVDWTNTNIDGVANGFKN